MTARAALRKAVLTGELPNIKTQVCTDCGAPAQEYHHHNGYEPEHWLDVIPLCHKCHRNRHRGPKKATSPDSESFINVSATPEDKQLLKALARRNGHVSQSAMVRMLIRQEASRQGITIRS